MNYSLDLIIASGYMNFSHNLMEMLKTFNQKIKLISASPQANGFHKAGRIKSYIPYFYRAFELNMLKNDKKS